MFFFIGLDPDLNIFLERGVDSGFPYFLDGQIQIPVHLNPDPQTCLKALFHGISTFKNTWKKLPQGSRAHSAEAVQHIYF